MKVLKPGVATILYHFRLFTYYKKVLRKLEGKCKYIVALLLITT